MGNYNRPRSKKTRDTKPKAVQARTCNALVGSSGGIAKTDIECLPVELLALIFFGLRVSEVLRESRVCKKVRSNICTRARTSSCCVRLTDSGGMRQWNEAANDRILWRNLSKRELWSRQVPDTEPDNWKQYLREHRCT